LSVIRRMRLGYISELRLWLESSDHEIQGSDQQVLEWVSGVCIALQCARRIQGWMMIRPFLMSIIGFDCKKTLIIEVQSKVESLREREGERVSENRGCKWGMRVSAGDLI
jgi:hypothetical protein